MDFLTTHQALAKLDEQGVGVSHSQLCHDIRSGKIRSDRIGQMHLIDPISFQEYLEYKKMRRKYLKMLHLSKRSKKM